MTRTICVGIVVATLSTAVLAQVSRDGGAVVPVPAVQAQSRKVLDTYCVTCHNSKVRTAGIAFDGMSLDDVHQNADVWEKALRKLRGRQMPPPGNRQPDQKEIDAFTSWMEHA